MICAFRSPLPCVCISLKAYTHTHIQCTRFLSSISRSMLPVGRSVWCCVVGTQQCVLRGQKPHAGLLTDNRARSQCWPDSARDVRACAVYPLSTFTTAETLTRVCVSRGQGAGRFARVLHTGWCRRRAIDISRLNTSRVV